MSIRTCFREVALEPLTGDAERELLEALVGARHAPGRARGGASSSRPRATRSSSRSSCARSPTPGALVRERRRLAVRPRGRGRDPADGGEVILARIDRLDPATHGVLTAASVLGRRFGLAAARGRAGRTARSGRAARAAAARPDPRRAALAAARVPLQARADPGGGVPALVADTRTALHRRAAEWLEGHHADNLDEVVGLLAYHWRAADDEGKAIAYLTRAGDQARQEWALDEAIEHYRALLPLLEARGERQEMALVLFKLALALHNALRFGEANETYGRAFELWTPPAARPPRRPRRCASARASCRTTPIRSRRSRGRTSSSACSSSTGSSRRGRSGRSCPSLAERWEISDDGLRYVFHLREGLAWSDGVPLTAHDVEFGIKRVLDPASPGSSVAIYFVLENGQDYYLGHSDDADAIGVRALDERTVEFRLVAPAPYFMSVMNRPDGGPQPRHAIEAHGAAWARRTARS